METFTCQCGWDVELLRKKQTLFKHIETGNIVQRCPCCGALLLPQYEQGAEHG